MIAYYALLSFVPLLFLLLFPLQFVGQQTESSFLIRQLSQAFSGPVGGRHRPGRRTTCAGRPRPSA